MRTALPVTLAAPPVIVVDRNLRGPIHAPELVPELLAARAVLPSGDGPLLVATTPVLLGDAPTSGQRMVSIHLDQGWRLECEVVGPPNREQLIARHIDVDALLPKAPDARLVALPGAPRFVASESEAEGTDLTPLHPVRHPFIESWIAYERLDRARGLQDLATRRAHPLEYSEVLGSRP